MSVQVLRPTNSTVQVRATAGVSQTYGQASAALGGLYPIPLAAYQMDKYRMLSGWPVSVPDYDISIQASFSCEGEVIANREAPITTETDALIRWIADQDQTFNSVSKSWYPSVGAFPSPWLFNSLYSPTYTDYEYRVGAERFYMNVVNFDADARQHMWANLSSVIGGSAGYTVLMAVNLHSVFGDNAAASVGLWCPGLPTPDADTFSEPITNFMSVTLRGETLYLETEQTAATKALPIADLLATTQPVFLAFCFGRPYSYIYAGAGPSVLRSVSTFTGKNSTPLSGNVVLGRTNGTRLNSADMGILDLGIYPDQLNSAQVHAEVAKLSAAYGGDK